MELWAWCRDQTYDQNDWEDKESEMMIAMKDPPAHFVLCWRPYEGCYNKQISIACWQRHETSHLNTNTWIVRVCSGLHIHCVDGSFSAVKASVNTAELDITKNVASISVCAFEIGEHVTFFIFVYCFKTTTCLSAKSPADIHLPSAVVTTLFPTQIKWHWWHLIDNYLLNPNPIFLK